jgi:uncharacterized protein (DUF1501 family)
MTTDPHACQEYNRLSRRQFVAWTSAAAAAAASAPAWMPRVSFARAFVSGRDVIVSIYLRGGADGLTLVPPYGDAAYYTNRPTIAIAPPSASDPNSCVQLANNGFFGLAPGMAALAPIFAAGDLAIIHAAGSADPSRSHFDAQRFMEVGKPADPTLLTGWLGRHIMSVSPADPLAQVRAIGIGYQLQLTLGGAPLGVPVPDLATYTLSGSSTTRAARRTWLTNSYNATVDPLKAAARNTQATIDALAAVNAGAYVPPSGTFPYPATTGTGASSFAKALKQTAALIRADIGVEAVAIDKGNWDLHSALGPVTGTMATNMLDLANSLRAFYEDVMVSGNKPVTVVIMSEFGRRVAENGSRGVDHGHGNVMFVMGRQINGGQVYGPWPGLGAGQLYQNLDLAVTTDYRDILAEIVQKRLQNPSLQTVFPAYTPTFRNIARVG